MNNRNRVDFEGVMVSNPEVTEGRSSRSTMFTVLGKEQGNSKEILTWASVKAFNSLADMVQRKGGKGAVVLIEGKLRSTSKITSKGRETSMYVLATRIHFLSPPHPNTRKEEAASEETKD